MKSISIKLGIGFNTLNKHLNILKQKGLVSFDATHIKLATNEDMKVKTENIIFVPKQIEKYSDIKIFLNSIPFLSKLYSQKRAISKKYHLRSIKYRGDNRYFLRRDEYKLYKRLAHKCNAKPDLINRNIIATISKVLECIDRRSSATAVKYKQFLKRFGIIDYENTATKVFSGVTYADFTYLRSNDLVEYRYTFFKGGCVWKYNPTYYKLTTKIL